jgi:predicted dehydrogenase
MNTSRRSFIKKTATAASALGFPTIIPSSVLGADGATAPSNRIVMGSVGWGMQGPSNTNQFLGMSDVQVVALCELDKKAMESGLNRINDHYGNKDAKGYSDYRELMARTDIDAVQLSVPDHWHALVSIEAAKAKKDIWGEKPLARTIGEQQAIVKACQANNIVWQTGSWQRSEDNFRRGAEAVRNGLIGKLQRVEVGLPSGHNDFAGTGKNRSASAPPAQLDYEMWIGPSRMEDYIEARVHRNWRWNYNTGGGQLLDWIGHHCDIAHWGMDMDMGGPVEVSCQGDMPAPTDVWNTCTKYRGTAKYANGVDMIIAGGHGDIAMGTKWIGDKGFIHVDRGGHFETNLEGISKKIQTRKGDKVEERSVSIELTDDQAPTRLYKTDGGHWRDLINCIRSRKPTVTPVTTAHHSAIPGHLCLISMLVGRALKWDPVKEVILGDDEASKLLNRPYRSPWQAV